MKTKKCNRCQEVKTEFEFHKDKTTKLGLYGFCKVCKAKATSKYHHENKDHRRNLQLKRYYGITLEDYNSMREKQNFCCYTCGTEEKNLRRGLLVDHNHTTGKVRKLLCDYCNVVLGKVKENTEILRNLIKYIDDDN